MVMMTKEGLAKIVNVMTPGTGVLVLESYSENALFLWNCTSLIPGMDLKI